MFIFGIEDEILIDISQICSNCEHLKMCLIFAKSWPQTSLKLVLLPCCNMYTHITQHPTHNITYDSCCFPCFLVSKYDIYISQKINLQFLFLCKKKKILFDHLHHQEKKKLEVRTRKQILLNTLDLDCTTKLLWSEKNRASI